jgi:hypothetical protein
MAMGALDLLRTEATALFARTGPGGTDGRHLVVMNTIEGVGVIGSPSLPAGIVQPLMVLASNAAPALDPLAPPAIIDDCRDILLRLLGASSLLANSGPSYLVTGGVRFATEARIERSDTSPGNSLRTVRPGNWEADEWKALVGGSLGPWAMATDHGEVVSICHTSLLTDDAAEAGTWTRPDHRGRGLAAATTAVWASILGPSGLRCFYSTSNTNQSSQAVARRLGLQLLGTLWWFGQPSPNEVRR